MKKFISALILILIANINCYSQNINLTEAEIVILISKTWKLDYGLSNGNKIQGLENVDDEYQFKSNNTYKIGSTKSSFVEGTWKFNAGKKRLELYSNTGNSSGFVKLIEKYKIILLPGEKSLPDNLKLEFIFIPKE